MQTFLPRPEFVLSASVLDNRRLGKQRVEVLQILTTLSEGRKAWSNHPAVRMWRGYEKTLCLYGLSVCMVWRDRGFKDTCAAKIEALWPSANTGDPPWLGDEKIHSSHRSNLLRKDPVWYGKFGWVEPSDMPYFWPV